MAVSPCKDCKDRVLGCHADCKRYLEFKDSVIAATQRRRLANTHRDYMCGLKHVTKTTGGRNR